MAKLKATEILKTNFSKLANLPEGKLYELIKKRTNELWADEKAREYFRKMEIETAGRTTDEWAKDCTDGFVLLYSIWTLINGHLIPQELWKEKVD